MKNWKLALAGFISVAPLAVSAEPTPLVNRLMNEPVSLFTMGMYRLNLSAMDSARRAGFSFGSASYDWDSNEIRIQAAAMPSTQLAKQCSSDQACEKALREALTTFAETFAAPLPNGQWVELVTDNFTQWGYTPKKFYEGKSLDSAVEDLSRIVKVSGSVLGGQHPYECRRELKSNEIFCSSKAAKH